MPEYKHARVRGYAPWNPSAESQRVVDGVLRVLGLEEPEYLPMTTRQVFYRLVAGGYEKTERAYARLCEKVNRARRAGMVRWDLIRDDGVSSRQAQWREDGWAYDSPSGYGRSCVAMAKGLELDASLVQPCHVEVHVEAAGMMPQIAQTACPLGASVYSSGGFGSATSQYEAAARMSRRAVPTVVLSIGDYDPSGVSLYWAWRQNVIAFVCGDIMDNFDEDSQAWVRSKPLRHWEDCVSSPDCYPNSVPLFRRIAVTPDQIRSYGLVTAPAKKTDKRGRWDGETVQCEAIPSRLLADIVRRAILEHYDEAAIKEVDALAGRLRPEVTKAAQGLVRLRGPGGVQAGLLGEVDAAARMGLVAICERVAQRRGGCVNSSALIRSELNGEPVGWWADWEDPGEWRAGHSNGDENDMEEGV